MSYESKTIKAVIEEIDQSKVYLPAIQRKFVWSKDQIELLFDSLMRNYPLGTFLFWKLRKEKADHYVFYEFLKEYDQRCPYNRRKTGAFLHPEITGILDGQQRLSSMYIGLMGTHTEKAPYKRNSNPNAYEKMCLYLNLLSLPYSIQRGDKVGIRDDRDFEFRFMTKEGAANSVLRRSSTEDGTCPPDEAMYWMDVGQVLIWDEEPELDRIIDSFGERCLIQVQREAILNQKRFILCGLRTLHKRIGEDKLINYFEVAKDDLEDILKIFVRVNSGGTVLNKTDLLFSTIVATWDDGREQIESLLKTINDKGDGFNFGNEYLMRCCLVLTDAPVVYKVNSFEATNVQKIQDEWPRVAEAIAKTVDLLVEFGFSGNVLTSQNATIIIAYYFYKGGEQDKESKVGIRKYLIHALLNGIFGSSQDQLITTLRNAFREKVETEVGGVIYRGRYRRFSFDEVVRIDLPQQKNLSVTETGIERFLQSSKGASSFLVLSLLYPHLRYNDVVFHQDHIHPAARFTEANFREMGVPEELWQEWLDKRDLVPNLQLMNGAQNISKSATALKDWVGRMSKSDKEAFARDNYFPENISLEFTDFKEFFEKRKQLLLRELKKVVTLTTTDQSSEALPEWGDRIEELGANDRAAM